ncbi:hypothetical protein CFN78_15935 [Amycolatopsis antarctica]|uniref:Uncharacterized protein n=1 Tax=Amycolatopsis antarctica TaxID=1854586 RepID=A0A263D4I6_9PSEU|nr:hypothetical protein CFN78_15935 [Amycolatopsis antarctica]
MVHASTGNECKLNVRSGPEVAPANNLATLNCANYTTCTHAAGESPCGPYVSGGQYDCVGPEGAQVTDDRWVEVDWRTPAKSYVAVACAAFAHTTDSP